MLRQHSNKKDGSQEQTSLAQGFWSHHEEFFNNLKKIAALQSRWGTGLGQAEQYCTLSVHMLSSLYSISGASLASVEVWRVENSTR
jgi:hypothetical protein